MDITKLIELEQNADKVINQQKFKFYQYQKDAIKSIISALASGDKKIILEMSTGTGKTVIASAVLDILFQYKISKRVLFLSSRRALVDQIYKVFQDNIGQQIIVSNDYFRCNASLIVLTFSKYLHIKNKTYENIDNNIEFDIVMLDDTNSNYRQIVSEFEKMDSNFIIFNNLEHNNRTWFNDIEPVFRYNIQENLWNLVSENKLIENQTAIIVNEQFDNVIKKVIKDKNLYNDVQKLYMSFENYKFNSIERDEILELINRSALQKSDIEILANKKKALSKFEEMLKDKKCDENQWQTFFEDNSWILGYSLNYVYTSSFDDQKLQKVIKGYDFNSNGKRVDALMKTNGLINSLCIVEIKTHKSPLTNNQYRKDCWSISSELAGAISQVQRYRQVIVSSITDKIEITGEDGEPTGETIYNYNPKAILIIGDLSEFHSEKGINKSKYSSFELFRKSISDIEILTYDELFDRTKCILHK